jgi:outer membrane protein assembly factor BamB
MISTKNIYYLTFCVFLFSISTNIYSQIQVEIPWPTLADSPWPMMSHDPQVTGRSPYVGPKTPNIIWTMDMPYGIFSGPAIGTDNTIYFGTFTYLFSDTTNYFYAVNPTGTLNWEFLTGEKYQNESGFLVGSDSIIYFCSGGGFVYAIDFDGNFKWKYNAGAGVGMHVMNTDLDGNLYFTSGDGYLHSIKRNGSLNWKIKFFGDGFIARSPAIAPNGQTIYIFNHHENFYALNLNGSIKWTFECNGGARQTPAVDNEGNVYIVPTDNPATLHSIRPDSTIRWSYVLNPNSGNLDMGSPAIDKNGNIYVTHYKYEPDLISSITAVDYNGNHKWTYTFEQVGEEIAQPLVVDADGTIYCGSTFGYYYYAISSEGKLLWKIPLNGYMVDNSTAIGSNSTLYIGAHLSSFTTGQKKTLIAIRDTGASLVNVNPFIYENTLDQNFPNPFNPTTKIKYSLPQTSQLIIKVFDILGNEIETLVNEEKSLGTYEITWYAENLPSGVYFYRLQAGNFIETKKMVLMK